MNHAEFLFFTVFISLILAVLLLDLGVFEKKNHVVKFRQALRMTILWVAVSLCFYLFLVFFGHMIHIGSNGSQGDIRLLIEKYGHPIKTEHLTYAEALSRYNHNLALEFLTGYLIEKSLSVDNIFVMVMIFMAFGVEQRYYRRVLLWGILAAIVLRFIFIFSASALILKFSWMLYVFGLLLIYTGIKMFITRNTNEQIDVAHHPVVKFASRRFPVYPTFLRQHFFVKVNGKWFITPLFLVLLVIEFSDLIFAVDSIPAIFSVTKDPYIVFFSNVFAILGLRAMFFLVVNVIDLFRYLKTGLAFLLVFIGAKMLVNHAWLDRIGFDTLDSLMIIAGILSISILLSVLFPEKKPL
ncbi:MAG: TerC/Alx family metal homeostasis membrane protein [Bacteroidales bacterium]|jgi:tellurite resistance protein TerC|nr:TerC/Alx family metal homeostasis membrane protein [Bacteroidales bacterium]